MAHIYSFKGFTWTRVVYANGKGFQSFRLLLGLGRDSLEVVELKSGDDLALSKS